MASEPFRFGRDFKRVEWRPTLQVNLLRASAAGVIFGVFSIAQFVISLFDGQLGIDWPALTSALLGPVVMPVVYLLFFLPLCLVTAKSEGYAESVIGIIAAGFVLIAALVVMIGDPLVFFLHRSRPRWVPIERYPFVAFCMILYVLRPLEAGVAVASEEGPSEDES